MSMTITEQLDLAERCVGENKTFEAVKLLISVARTRAHACPEPAEDLTAEARSILEAVSVGEPVTDARARAFARACIASMPRGEHALGVLDGGVGAPSRLVDLAADTIAPVPSPAEINPFAYGLTLETRLREATDKAALLEGELRSMARRLPMPANRPSPPELAKLFRPMFGDAQAVSEITRRLFPSCDAPPLPGVVHRAEQLVAMVMNVRVPLPSEVSVVLSERGLAVLVEWEEGEGKPGLVWIVHRIELAWPCVHVRAYPPGGKPVTFWLAETLLEFSKKQLVPAAGA